MVYISENTEEVEEIKKSYIPKEEELNNTEELEEGEGKRINIIQKGSFN
jgi:hypothetical protein